MIVYSRKARLCGTKPSRLERNMNSNQEYGNETLKTKHRRRKTTDESNKVYQNSKVTRILNANFV